MSRRISRRSLPRRAKRSRPSKRTLPEVGAMRRTMVRARVDLPHPDSPTRPSVSPLAMFMLTPESACTSARRPNMPCLVRYPATRSVTSSTGGVDCCPTGKHLLCEVACAGTAWGDLPEQGFLLPASFTGEGATGMEDTPGRQVRGVGRLPFDGSDLLPLSRARGGCHQPRGVGVGGCAVDIGDRTGLYRRTCVHQHDRLRCADRAPPV